MVALVLPLVLGAPESAPAADSAGGVLVAQGPGSTRASPPSAGGGPSAAPGAPAAGAPTPIQAVPPPLTVPSARPFSLPSLLTRPTGQPLARFELHPSAFLSEEYSDNFEQSSRNKRDNFRTTLGVNLTLVVNTGLVTGQISGGIGATHDTATDDTDFDVLEDASLDAELTWQAAANLTLTIGDSLRRSDDAAVADALGLRQGREGFTTNTFWLASDYRIGTIATHEYYRLVTFFDDAGPTTITHLAGASASKSFLETMSGSLGYAFVRSDSSNGDSDVTGHEVNASVSRLLNISTAVGISGSYAIRDVSSGTDYWIASGAIFGSYQVAPIWSANASVGYSHLQPESGSNHGSPSASAAFVYQLPRGTFTLSGSAGFSETFTGGENFGVVETWGVAASFAYPLTPLITTVATVFYRHNRFTGLASDEPERSEDVWGGSLGFSVPLRTWLTFGVQYRYIRVNSPLDERDFAENRVRASLTATF